VTRPRFDNTRIDAQLPGMTPPELDVDEQLCHAAAIIKCLGHPLRLRILEALESGEMTVSALQEYAAASQSTVSQQLSILRGKAVVDCRREGVHVYYWITEPRVHRILACLRECCGD